MSYYPQKNAGWGAPVAVINIRRTKKPLARSQTPITEGGYLMHFGIKGQKWGVRRFQNEDGSLTEEGKQRYNDRPESESWKKSDAEYLSDEELRRRNNRLQAERQYRDLTTSQVERERIQRQKDIVNRVIIGTALSLATVAMRGKWKQAASFISKFAKKSFTKLRTSNALKNGINQLKNAGEQYSHPAGSPRTFRAGGVYGIKDFIYRPKNYGGIPRNLKWPKL